MLRIEVVPFSWKWAAFAAVLLALGCDPVQRYAAPGRTPSALAPPRGEGLGEQLYELAVTPEVTYRVHAYWFSGVVNLIGELENSGTEPILVDDRRAMLQLAHGIRLRAASLSQGTELLHGKLGAGEKHKTHYKFSVPNQADAADVTFVHEGLNAMSGETLRLVAQLVDADTR